MKIAELLDLARANSEIPSNYRLARILGVSDQTIWTWKTGKKWPDEEMAARLAELAGLDPGQVVASIKAERAEPGPMRDLWLGVAERLSRTAVAGVAALVTITGSPDAGAMAKVTDQAPETATPIIMSSRLLRSVARLVARLRMNRGSIARRIIKSEYSGLAVC